MYVRMEKHTLLPFIHPSVSQSHGEAHPPSLPPSIHPSATMSVSCSLALAPYHTHVRAQDAIVVLAAEDGLGPELAEKLNIALGMVDMEHSEV